MKAITKSAIIGADFYPTDQNMHILVPIKVVPDYKMKLQLNDDQNGINTNGVKMILNPFDAIALQAAVNIKKQHSDTKITSVFIATDSIPTLIRESLALGADQAIHITANEPLISLSIAKILQKITLDNYIDLVLMGKQAIDSDANQTAPMLASLLDWPNINYISDISINKHAHIHTTCEWDDGLVNIQSQLPAVISCDLRLNTPAPANMMAIMKAKQKPVQTMDLAELDLNLNQHQTLLSLAKPAPRAQSVTINNIDQLVDIIKTLKEQI